MLQFVREIPVRIVIDGALSQRRGFLFRLQAGFSKSVDPLSGMSMDLEKVNQWLAAIQRELQAQIFYSVHADNFNAALLEIHEATWSDLQGRAQTDGATLESLCWVEERGMEISWSASSSQVVLKTRHFIEDLSEGHFELLKLKLSWALSLGDGTETVAEAVDLGHKGFLLLRGVEFQRAGSFMARLVAQVRQDEFAQRHLVQVEIEFVASERVLTLEKMDFQSGL